MGEDIISEVQAFFQSGSMPRTVNETHIRLIPKIRGPKKVSDYRPIALCNVYYKIISKLLARCIQPLLRELVSETQSAFVPKRAISDNVLITHEILHYLKTSKASKQCSMAIKTDMSKAYDRLEWDFIRDVLLRFGFHPIWTEWIMQCLTSVTYSFIINGASRGQLINTQKSSISFSHKTNQTTKNRIKQILGIEMEGGVGKYLGLPEHCGRRK